MIAFYICTTIIVILATAIQFKTTHALQQMYEDLLDDCNIKNAENSELKSKLKTIRSLLTYNTNGSTENLINRIKTIVGDEK